MSPPEKNLVPRFNAILILVTKNQAKHYETVNADEYVHFEIMG
jgi:hypothetical protein